VPSRNGLFHRLILRFVARCAETMPAWLNMRPYVTRHFANPVPFLFSSQSPLVIMHTARMRYVRDSLFEALRRHQILLVMVLAFLGPAIPPDPQVFGIPVLVLVGTHPSLMLRMGVLLSFLSLVAIVFIWLRPLVLGGRFRGYGQTLPWATNTQRTLDARVTARTALVFLLPLVFAWWLLPDMGRADTQPILLLANLIGASVLFVALVGAVAWAVTIRAPVLTACAVGAAIIACGVPDSERGLRIAVYAALAIALAFVGQREPRVHVFTSAHFVSRGAGARMFAFARRPIMQLVGLPLAVLWHKVRAPLLSRVVLTATLFSLAAVGVLVFDMRTQWRGLTATTMSAGIVILAGLFDALRAERLPVRSFRTQPQQGYWSALSDITGLIAIALPLFAALSGALWCGGFAAAPKLGLLGLIMLAATRALSLFPLGWQTPLLPVLAIVWALLVTFAI
jgi:hypothetical protein